MSIQMLATWGGYEEHSVQTLASQEEARLIGLGLARAYAAGQDGQSPLPVSYNPATGALVAGNAEISSVVSGAGNLTRSRAPCARVTKRGTPVLASSGDTYQQIASVDAPSFNALQLVLYSFNTSAVAGMEASFAATELSTETRYPLVNGAQSTDVKTVTWGGATTGTLPVAPASTGDGDSVLSSLVSDIIPCASVPRAEAGFSLPLYLLRMYNANTGATIYFKNSPGNIDVTVAANADGRTFKNFKATGAKVLTGGGTFPASPNIQLLAHVIAYTADTCYTVLSAGDSIAEGVLTVTGVDGVGEKAARIIRKSGIPCGHVQGGWGSQTPPAYFANGRTLLGVHKPTVTLIPVFSPNGCANKFAPTSAEVNWMLTQADAFARDVIAAGSLPIFVGPCAADSLTGGAGGGQAMYSRLITEWGPQLAARYRAPFFDLAGAIGADPVTYAFPPGGTDDGTHYSDDQGQQAAVALAPVIGSLLR